MTEKQLDLFSAGGIPPTPRSATSAKREATSPGDLDDVALITAIPAAGIVDGPALATEAGHRRLLAAVPALEELCRRFAGFGVDRAVPEQVAALEALAMIGGREAARAVARVAAKGAVQGPALKVAMAAAAQLGANLPTGLVVALMQHADPGVRADACRCVRGWPQAVPILLDLQEDPHRDVSAAAACALGRLGRREVLPALIRLLRQAPSREVIEAVTPIADEDCLVLLARIGRTMPDLADAARDALDVIDHPRAARWVSGRGRWVLRSLPRP
jgi:HEAT repeat protein